MLSTDKVLIPREIAWDYALTAQMNVLYYQRKVARWTRWDEGIRVAAGVAASGTLLALMKKCSVWGIDVAAILSGLAATGSIVGAALRLPDKVRGLGVLLAQYTAHQSTFERLYQFGCSDKEIKAALRAFSETEQREAKDHPEPDTKLIAESQALVLTRIKPAA